MALAFSRSTETSSCGSFEVKVVFMPVSSWPPRALPTRVCAMRSMSPKVLRPEACRMNWKPPTVPMPATAGGSAAGDAEELRRDVGDDGFGRELFAHLGAIVDGFERCKDEAGVW